jgi:hypothetical protein
VLELLSTAPYRVCWIWDVLIMRKYEDKQVTRRTLIALVCDLCKKEVIVDRHNQPGEWPAPISRYSLVALPEKTIRTQLERSDYTYWGSPDWSVDRKFAELCPDCMDRVLTWLQSQGCTIQEENDGS